MKHDTLNTLKNNLRSSLMKLCINLIIIRTLNETLYQGGKTNNRLGQFAQLYKKIMKIIESVKCF